MKSKIFTISTIIVIVLIVACSNNKEQSAYSKRDTFVEDLMKKMTLEEKIGQLTLFSSGYDITGPTMHENYANDIKAGKVGAVFNAYGVKFTTELQKMAVEETRLGIPLLFGYDVIHGHRTIFPIPLGETASWDMDYIEKSARIAAIEATSEGLHWTFAPMIDVTRDPRWGRIAEGSGEDPFLTSMVARAKVRGYQGKDFYDVHTMLACAKHFAAYGAPQGGRDYHTVDMSEIELRNTYLPPFKAAINEGVATFMTAFNELFGVPATGSKYLLTDVLRGEWKFKGFVVTDYTSIKEMIPHGFAKDEKHAGELAINAGVDLDMQSGIFNNHLKNSIDEGKVSIKTIDNAVRRILNLKYELGLFEDPYRYSNIERQHENILTSEHLEFARDFARRSIVLLKNENNTLPLSKDIKSIAVIGPLADSQKDMIGSWSAAGDYKKSVTLLQGIKNKVGENTRILHTIGTGVNDNSREGFSEAIRLAKASDAIVLAIGEHKNMSGEAASRSDINLPGLQEELALELAKIGKPLIVVLMNGRPLTIEKVDQEASAILETWFLGTTAGDAIADVLFGDYNPSGKLPVTFPRNGGQVPTFYNEKNTGRPYSEQKYTSKYLDVPNTPLYPFGHGLSYTTFKYSEIKLEDTLMSKNKPLLASIIVTNTGNRFGEEVVQLYTRQLVGSITRPVKELKAFKKIGLEPGESFEVTFRLTWEDIAFYNSKNQFVTEPGEFNLFIGTSSQQAKEISFAFHKD
ncbi:MAG: glycoside hydrolase family 3 N-terminal domain-containing protein [Tenuifilaceae bacterium]|nr:glycoside hydrolase family 3 N-terminal domain-containing protein [Tenuifilaceae bacterium]